VLGEELVPMTHLVAFGPMSAGMPITLSQAFRGTP